MKVETTANDERDGSLGKHFIKRPLEHSFTFDFYFFNDCPGFFSFSFYFFVVLAYPKVGTRWIRSTFSSHCQLSSNQHRWLTSGTSIIYSSEMFWKCWESNPGQQGPQASMLTNVLCCPLCSIFFAKQRLRSLGYCAPLTFTKLLSGWGADLEVVAL